MTVKRIFDLILASLLLIPAGCVVLVAAIFVRLDSDGGALFLQQRVGRNRKTFRMIKLRTMRQGTATGASHEIGEATITRVGAILRKTKADELPQVWSVLVGDMSFVGPRPCLPVQGRLIEERDTRGVFAVRPGITGLAQTMGVDMSEPEHLAEIDARYVAQWTLMGDIRLIILTATGAGCFDAASGSRKA